LAFVARKFEVGEVWTNGAVRDVPFMHRFEEILQARNIVSRAVSGDDRALSVGNCRSRVLNPRGGSTTGAENLSGKQQNNQSVVFRLECGGATFLFTGDVEREAEAAVVEAGYPLRAGILKVPHHGARGSVYEPFLSAVRPDIAVVSVGTGNSYGHPAPAMLETYARLGIRVLRTDLDGAITVTGTPSGIEVACEAGRRMQPIKWHGHETWAQEARNLRRAVLGEAGCSSKA
jgi:competence protein ComEC